MSAVEFHPRGGWVTVHDPRCPELLCSDSCLGWENCDHVCACRLIIQVTADEQERISAIIDGIDSTGIAPFVNHGFPGDPKPYPLEDGCGECHGEVYGADAALDVALALIRP